MISINGKKLEVNHFPDGTQHLNTSILTVSCDDGCWLGTYSFLWQYESDEELVTLMYLVKHLQDTTSGCRFILRMPYLPNARMDRWNRSDVFRDEVFTLKYFCNAINSMGFDCVHVFDPHSDVGVALLDRVVVREYDTLNLVDDVYQKIKGHVGPVLFFPDAGAYKKYASKFCIPSLYGEKIRDWSTGKIKSLAVHGTDECPLDGSSVLIVDDICSRGGTVHLSAKALKKLGAGDIYLYVSHCENTIFEGELLKGDLVKRIYTTDSILTKSHEKIEIVHSFFAEHCRELEPKKY